MKRITLVKIAVLTATLSVVGLVLVGISVFPSVSPMVGMFGAALVIVNVIADATIFILLEKDIL